MTQDPRHESKEEADGADGQDFHARVAGQELRIRKYRAMDVVLILSVLGVFVGAVLVYQDQKELRQKEANLVTLEHMHLRQEIKGMKEATEEQTFVLTLSQAKREALNLDMPETLRRKAWGFSNHRDQRDRDTRGDSTKGGLQ